MLPPSIELNRPNPLGEQVQRIVDGTGHNAHAVADQIALDATPADQKPRWLRAEAKAKEKARALLAETEQAEAAKLRDYEVWCSLCAQIVTDKKHIAWGEDRLGHARATVEAFPSDFLKFKNLNELGVWAGAVEAAKDVVLCRELIAVLPGWLVAANESLAELERKAAELEKRYGGE